MVILNNMSVDDGNCLNEDLAYALQEFAKSGLSEIQPALDAYITSISLSGETRASWHLLKPLLRVKLDNIITSFNQDTPVDNLYPRPNMDTFKFATYRSQILSCLDEFPDAPFSIQRLCELIQSPRKHYKRVDNFMRGVIKVLSVTSCVDPHGVKIVSDRERHFSDTTTSSVNGGEYPSMPSPRPRRDSRAVSPSFDGAEFRTSSESSDMEISHHSPMPPFQTPVTNCSPGRRSRSPGGTLLARPNTLMPLSDPDMNGHGHQSPLSSPDRDTTSPKRPRLHDGVLLGPPSHPAPVKMHTSPTLGSPTESGHTMHPVHHSAYFIGPTDHKELSSSDTEIKFREHYQVDSVDPSIHVVKDNDNVASSSSGTVSVTVLHTNANGSEFESMEDTEVFDPPVIEVVPPAIEVPYSATPLPIIPEETGFVVTGSEDCVEEIPIPVPSVIEPEAVEEDTTGECLAAGPDTVMTTEIGDNFQVADSTTIHSESSGEPQEPVACIPQSSEITEPQTEVPSVESAPQ